VTDFVYAIIRTYVPIIVGAAVAWLVTLGLPVSDELQAGAVVLLTGALQALYYLLVKTLEHRWPKLGVLLGTARAPSYDSSGDAE